MDDGQVLEEARGFFGFDVTPYARIVRFQAGDSILTEGKPSPTLFYLAEGRAKLSLIHANGRISLISFLDAPCFVGEMELLGARETPNQVTAVTASVCCALDTRACGERMLRDLKFLRCLCVYLSRKAVGNTANYTQNQSYPLKTRLARFILLTSLGGCYRERHTEAAEYLGVSYRHLLYVLAEFVEKGLLERTNTGYRLLDEPALRQIAAGERISQAKEGE